MAHRAENSYLFSIQPFWESEAAFHQISGLSGEIAVNQFHWSDENLLCVAGNGQVGIMLQEPDAFRGYCYGVATDCCEVPLYKLKKGYSIRFSPGTFSRIFGIPSSLLDPKGVIIEDIFPTQRIEKMKEALASSTPDLSLIKLFGRWLEQSYSTQEYQLANQVIHLIWEKRGQIQIRELEWETTYSARYLRDVVGRQVGITPKQICRQIRFQNALHLLRTNPDTSLSWAAHELGYTDQAHFTKEFKYFSTLCPAQFQKRNLTDPF